MKEGAGGKGLCPLHIFVAGMAEVICQGDGPLRVRALDERDEHPRLNHPLLHHPAIPASAPGLSHTCSQPLDTPASLDFQAWILDLCFANGVDVANTRLLFGQPIHCKVFAEASGANLWQT